MYFRFMIQTLPVVRIKGKRSLIETYFHETLTCGLSHARCGCIGEPPCNNCDRTYFQLPVIGGLGYIHYEYTEEPPWKNLEIFE